MTVSNLRQKYDDQSLQATADQRAAAIHQVSLDVMDFKSELGVYRIQIRIRPDIR